MRETFSSRYREQEVQSKDRFHHNTGTYFLSFLPRCILKQMFLFVCLFVLNLELKELLLGTVFQIRKSKQIRFFFPS